MRLVGCMHRKNIHLLLNEYAEKNYDKKITTQSTEAKRNKRIFRIDDTKYEQKSRKRKNTKKSSCLKLFSNCCCCCCVIWKSNKFEMVLGAIEEKTVEKEQKKRNNEKVFR